LLIDTTPAEEIFMRSAAAVLSDNVSVAGVDKPVVVLPVKFNDGASVVPTGNVKFPVIVSPDFNTLFDALPVKFAVIVPALKLPDASRATMELAVFALVASVVI